MYDVDSTTGTVRRSIELVVPVSTYVLYVYRATGGTGRDGRVASREFAPERSARVEVLSTCH